MKTIYLREKRSGNFEITTKENATHSFNTKKHLVEFYSQLGSKRIVKATYRLAQTYFSSVNELLLFVGEKPVKNVPTTKRVADYRRYDL